MAASTVDLAIIGAGPTAASLLERLSANATELLGGADLRIHLIDPERVGTGRVWRPELSPLLWMNSLAEDVTMFTDASVRCAGPVRPGPSLAEWAATVDGATLAEVAPDGLVEEVRAVTGTSFPARRVQAAYLEWFHRLVLSELAPNVSVTVHRARAVDLAEQPDGKQVVHVEAAGGGTAEVRADVVVLALGHLDAAPDANGQALADFAARHGLTYVAAGHTADLDLSVLRGGETVLVSGFGQAFTDLAVLVSEGRGGHFHERPDGTVRYEPSGREPVLVVGSRRGVPYRSKLDYRMQAPLAPLPRFFGNDAIEDLLARPGRLEFSRDLFPLIAKEVCWAYYHELLVAHPDRANLSWERFAARYEPLRWGPEIDALVAEAVPAPADRFDFAALDRPLAGLAFGSGAAAHAHVASHIAADVARRTDPAFSADLGAFLALLLSFGALARVAASGRMTDRSRVEDVSGTWFSFFMYYASGPPPARLRQYLALADAGLLRFGGADLTIVADEERGCFVARSSSHADEVVATALVDARIAAVSVSRTTDRLLANLAARGEVTEEVVSDGSGWQVNTGKVVVAGPDLLLVHADGSAHPRRHGLGAFTNRPASGVLSRPRANAPTFRQNDAVARAVLSTLAAVATRPVGPVGPVGLGKPDVPVELAVSDGDGEPQPEVVP